MARGAAAPDHDDEKEHDFWRTFVSQRRDRWAQAGLDDILEGMPRMEFMLRFVLGHPDLHTTIVGTSNPSHLANNVEVAHKGPLPEGLHAEAQRRIRAATG